MLLAVLVIAAYAHTFGAGFLHWDDPEHITQNLRVTAPDGVARIWSDTSDPGFLPLTYLTWFVEWRLGAGHAWLFRLDNVLLHAANVVLAAWVARAVGLSMPLALAAAGLWGLHPIDVASVSWITERKNVLYAFFFLASLLLYDRATARDGRTETRWYLLSLASYCAALLSKGAAMTLFPVLLLFEWARGRSLVARLPFLAPYALLAIGAGMLLVSGTPLEAHVSALDVRVPLAARATWFYAGKFFWPASLVPLYPKWIETAGPIEASALVAALGVTAAVALLWRRLPRPALFGVGFFLVNLAPVVGVVWFTFFRLSLVSDHLAYLPTLGIALAAVATIAEAARRLRVPERPVLVALALWIGILTGLTYRQATLWSDGPAMWRASLAADPSSFPAHTGLGDELVGHDDAAAIVQYETALGLRAHAGTELALAKLYWNAKRSDDAVGAFERSIALGSDSWEAPYGLGSAFLRLDRSAEAVPLLERAHTMNPGSVDVENNLGIAYLEVGNVPEARASFEAASRLDPGAGGPAVGLGSIVERHDGADAARAYYERVLTTVRAGPDRTRLEDRLAAVSETVRRRAVP